jgi:hypothetical protein
MTPDPAPNAVGDSERAVRVHPYVRKEQNNVAVEGESDEARVETAEDREDAAYEKAREELTPLFSEVDYNALEAAVEKRVIEILADLGQAPAQSPPPSSTKQPLSTPEQRERVTTFVDRWRRETHGAIDIREAIAAVLTDAQALADASGGK